jgi:isopentenyldiphosphate isomerase
MEVLIMAEKIDIYDAELRYIGVMERIEAHMKGHWHKTFHCWVVTKKEGGYILFQLRSPEMINFPNMLDVSAAGHLEAGEDIKQGIREVSEELGIPISMESLHSLGYRVEVADQDNGQKNREYQAVNILNLDIPLSEYKPQIEEVSGLLWLKIREGLDLFTGKRKYTTMQGIVYNKQSEEWNHITRKVTIKDFLPRIQNYYLTMCIMAERLLENKFPLAIS